MLTCPHCHLNLSEICGHSLPPPDPGSCAVCRGCGSYLVFNEHSIPHIMDGIEWNHLPQPIRLVLHKAREHILNHRKEILSFPA